MSFEAHKVVFEQGPADASEFENLVTSGAIQPDRVAAVIGKTEGNGGVNDFTRILADRAFRDVLRRHGNRDEAAVSAIPMVWSGGTDGVLCPHACVFNRVDDEPPGWPWGSRGGPGGLAARPGASDAGRFRREPPPASQGRRRRRHRGGGR